MEMSGRQQQKEHEMTAMPISAHFPGRGEHLRATYNENLALYLASGDAFRITSGVTPEMAALWRDIFEDLTRRGYMRRSQTGRFRWNRYAVSVIPAGPGRCDWRVHDTLRDRENIVKSGHVTYPVDWAGVGITKAHDQAWAAGYRALAKLLAR
jgi:hypothetical protein